MYTSDAYQWCSKTDPGPIFNEPTHQNAYCALLTGAQIGGTSHPPTHILSQSTHPTTHSIQTGVASVALGLAAIFLAFLLACNSIKNKERKHVTGLLATLMFFQTVGALVRLPPTHTHTFLLLSLLFPPIHI